MGRLTTLCDENDLASRVFSKMGDSVLDCPGDCVLDMCAIAESNLFEKILKLPMVEVLKIDAARVSPRRSVS